MHGYNQRPKLNWRGSPHHQAIVRTICSSAHGLMYVLVSYCFRLVDVHVELCTSVYGSYTCKEAALRVA